MPKTTLSKNAKTLLERLDNRTAVIGVIGLGYVGLPLVLRFSEVGFKTIGFDVDEDKIRKLQRGQSYIEHIKADRIRAGLKTGMRVTSDMSQVRKVDAVIMCVPTPLNKYREPDLSFVLTTVDSVLPYLHTGQVVSLESTTYPGTTEEEIRPRIESRGFTVGRDVFVVFSPEREDPGNANYNTKTIPKVCGGSTKTCLEVGVRLYGSIVDKVVPVSSTQTAEMTKLLENIHRAVNIGLVNEMKMIADRMNIDIHEVIRAAASKPFGFTPYSPGPGIGGHCIPIDPFYLTWKAREFGFNTRFIELSGDVNSRMPDWVVEKVSQALNQKGKAISRSNVLVLGIAYKKNVDDVRESPSIEIMEILRKLGAGVAYSDPYVPSFPRMRHHRFNLKNVALTPAALRKFDCVVIATNHDSVDYEMLRKHAALIVDTRAVYPRGTKNVVPA